MTPGAVSAPESCTRGGTEVGVARGAGSIGAVVEVLTSPPTLPARPRDTSHVPLSPQVPTRDPRYGGNQPPWRGTRAPVT